MQLKSVTITDLLLVCFVALKPLYLRSSGGLQISDLFLLTLFTYLAMVQGVKFKNKALSKWIGLFFAIIVYQFIINTVWTAVCLNQGIRPINRGDSMMFQTLYYLFNFLVSLSIILMAERYGKSRVIDLFISGILIASVISLIGLFVGPSAKRSTGFFNNPNQLGYFSMITLTVGVMFKERMSRFTYLTILVSSLLGVMLSLSKAAIIPASLLLVIQYLNIGKKDLTINRLLISILMILAVSAGLYLVFYSKDSFALNNRLIQSIRFRIENMGNESDSNLYYGRGYGRINEIGILSLIGVGEGIYSRFAIMNGIEAHSLFASLIVSYGLVGFISYIFLFLKPFFSGTKRWYELSLFVPVLLYNVSHNGIRNTLLWALISILLVEACMDSDEEETAA